MKELLPRLSLRADVSPRKLAIFSPIPLSVSSRRRFVIGQWAKNMLITKRYCGIRSRHQLNPMVTLLLIIRRYQAPQYRLVLGYISTKRSMTRLLRGDTERGRGEKIAKFPWGYISSQ